jgi:alkylation response protein AidB-like acyl-CoA dehydrogenase
MDPDAAAVIERARAIADTVLFPRAQDVDRGVATPHDGLRALADAGLFGISGPSSHGGSDLDPLSARRVIASVGSGCGATFFVWVQHLGVVRSVRSSPNTALVDELLGRSCAGELIAGVAFAHVRRAGPPAIVATPHGDGGWRLDGHAPWVTSWGIADRFCVAAETATGELVWSMIPASATTGVTATPLALPVFGATGTVAVTFDGCTIAADQVVTIEDAASWRATDRVRAATGQPAVLGVAERAVRLLDATDDDACRAAHRLREELAAAWRRDDALVGASPSDDIESHIAAASDHRAACLDLARRATTALIAATGGRAMDLDHPAQRLAREADFYVIQAQTADGRAATLRSV